MICVLVFALLLYSHNYSLLFVDVFEPLVSNATSLTEVLSSVLQYVIKKLADLIKQ